MSHDINLQKAIYASLQTAPRPRPVAAAPVRFSSTFAPPARSRPSRTVLPSDSIGAATRGACARDGIVPVATARSSTATSAQSSAQQGESGTVRSSLKRVDSSSSRGFSRTDSSSAKNEAASGPISGWSRKVGRGTLSKGSTSEKDGRSGCLNGEGCSSMTAIVCELMPDASQISSGSFAVSFSLQASCTQTGIPSPAAAVLLDIKSYSPADHFALVFATGSKSWRAERVVNGQTTLVAERRDNSLKGGAWMNLEVTVSEGKMSMECDGKSVFTSLPMRGEDALQTGISTAGPGALGLGAVRARLEFKGFCVRSCGDGGSGSGGMLPAPAASSLPTKERYSGDDPKLVEYLERDVMDTSLGVEWDDIAALDDVKSLLQEACVLPLLIPELYTGIRQPWKGVLLFGPPGTGKTLLAKAVASQARTTFFNVSASTVVSKYMGESERLVRALFSMARHYAPSTVFLDEIDGLLSARGGSAEHEASRRLKSEFLSQMDGLAGGGGRGAGAGARVMVLATSNKPWDLDEALRRRLEKRVYVGLPSFEGRRALMRRLLRGLVLAADVDLDALAKDSDGYSGADLEVVCREAAMAPLRRYGPQEMLRLRESKALTPELLGVSMQDLVAALGKTPRSVAPAELPRFLKWQEQFASL